MKQIIQKLIVMVPLFLWSQNPNWQVNSANYTLDASLTVRLKINGDFLADSNDRVAAFDEAGNVRGVAGLIENGSTGVYYSFLTVLSNTSGVELSFKIYDASEDKVLEVTDQSYSFVASEVFGSPASPFIIEAMTELSLDKVNLPGFHYFVDHQNQKLHMAAKNKLDQLVIVNSNGAIVKQVVLGLTSSEVVDISALSSSFYIGKLKSGAVVKAFKFVK